MANFFLDEEHKQCFLDALYESNRLHNGLWIDQEYGAALYLMTSENWMWEVFHPYFLVNGRQGIDFEGYLKDVVTSSGEAVLVNAAWDLFNGGGEAQLIELMRLDEKNFELVINALRIRQKPMKLSEVE